MLGTIGKPAANAAGAREGDTERMSQRRGRSWKRMAALLCSSTLAGCALFTPLPKPSTLDERLQAMPSRDLPLQGTVRVHWDEHQIPFIEADSDDDAAFALGLVHAHLRLGQMAVYRRIAQGRVSEMGGPLATDIDHGLRILDFGRATAATETALPEPTRRWLQRFVDGVNHYQATAKPLPLEYRILALEREPWTVADVLTFGRLAGTDVTWLVWFNLLKLRHRSDWPQIWARLVRTGGDRSIPAGSEEQQDTAADADTLGTLLGGIGRTGSNSLAIGPQHTKTGAPILANDPHLGLNLPNSWLIAGLKSPSYHVVGLMVPGLPLFAIGRNPQIAWGGTNMRAATSDLIDISGLPASDISSRNETIHVRWWQDRTVPIRSTRFGPVLSDAPQLEDLELPDTSVRWSGHQPSDEVSAMLGVARAGSFEEFRAAFARFAVPGQNMLYADAAGNIGRVLAVRVPDRGGAPPADLILSPEAGERTWQTLRDAEDLPATLNPPEGFIASANNRPRADGADVGWFFSPEDRIERMAALLDDAGRVDATQVKAWQRDVHVNSSAELNRVLVDALRTSGVTETATPEARLVYELMAGWDGDYTADSQAPVAFELFRYHITRGLYHSVFGDADWSAFAGVGEIKTLLIEDIRRQPPETLQPALRTSLAAAGAELDRFATWGDMHRMVLRHPLAFLPVIGKRFVFADYPVGGSSDSLMKTAHAATDEKHQARYGANARHVSDLGDLDANWFVLLGGQDGWLNSSTFLDQVPSWREGRYIQMPLRLETVRRQFTRVTELRP